MKSAVSVLRSHTSLLAATVLASMLAVTACSGNQEVTDPVAANGVNAPAAPGLPSTPSFPGAPGVPGVGGAAGYINGTNPVGGPATSGSTASTPAGSSSVQGGTVTRYVSSYMLNVRSQPDINSKIVRAILGGVAIQCQEVGGFCKIKDGQFVRSKYLSATPTKKVTTADFKKAQPAIGAGTPKKDDKKKDNKPAPAAAAKPAEAPKPAPVAAAPAAKPAEAPKPAAPAAAAPAPAAAAPAAVAPAAPAAPAAKPEEAKK